MLASNRLVTFSASFYRGMSLNFSYQVGGIVSGSFTLWSGIRTLTEKAEIRVQWIIYFLLPRSMDPFFRSSN